MTGPEHAGEDELRVLFCGSRTFRDGDTIKALIGGLVKDNEGQGLVVIHGGAKGVDSLADFYARWWRASVEEFPADWDQYGKRAGYIRNKEMLEDGKPDRVYAVIDKPLAESKGTAMMVKLAVEAGVPTFTVEYHAPPPMTSSGGDTR